MRTVLFVLLLPACAVDGEEWLAPPPGLFMAPPPSLPIEDTTRFYVDGAWPNETVYLISSRTGLGLSCPSIIMGNCMSINAPLSFRAAGVADATGRAAIDVVVPFRFTGMEFALQAVTVRGIQGENSMLSGAFSLLTALPVSGCTDPLSATYDPAANVDDGSCL